MMFMENNIGLIGKCPTSDIGLSVTEFARAAQTTRAAVGKFIKYGDLKSVTTDRGQIRVLTTVKEFLAVRALVSAYAW